ncbi:uncharacterized protein LOC129600283 [Paramacrobiotus metropolitanus]|uniref:uncharacterized protein LOC129600283 n=1 Tax=Paramacrobiotus metropolitanus TaxID=2943436 RepID=UPI00244581F5|nr:uncharacterized protein LOC129600283 [Paramacrobiotus metropolitanus]
MRTYKGIADNLIASHLNTRIIALICAVWAGLGGWSLCVAGAAAVRSAACPPLLPPPNAFISLSDAGEAPLARYVCLPGYELFGAAERQCRSGRWLGQRPACAINIAIRQPAKQTSNATEFTAPLNRATGPKQAYEAAAYLAVDGTRIYCSSTLTESQPVWSVQLARDYPVVAVKLYTDTSTDLSDLEVAVVGGAADAGAADAASKKEPASSISTNKQNVMLFSCAGNVTGRQVLIKRHTYASLRLCEVQVFSQEGVACQHPGAPANGIVKLSQVEWPFPPGTVAVYECNAGFQRIPTDANFHRTCLINGTWDTQEPVCVTNVAQFKLAKQSSLFSQYNYPAWQAVDNDATSCAWTRRERTSWLQIDLLKPYNIHAVSVLLDKERLFYQFHRNVLISISNRSDEQPAKAGVSSSGSPLSLTFRRNLQKDVAPGSGIFYLDTPTVGRYVTLSAVGSADKFLGVCDLQILASDEMPASPDVCGLQTPATAAGFLHSFKRQCLQTVRFTATSWANAAVSCQDNGGALLVNPDYDTTLFLTNVLSNLYRFHTSDDRYWIGARRNADDDKWVFSVRNKTLPVESTYWAPGRPAPDVAAGEERCAALGGQGVGNWAWAEYRCDQEANWICAYGAKGCGDPPQPEASALLVADKLVGVNGWKVGDHVQYECAPGHLLTGSAERLCQPDGTWSGQDAGCHYVSCGEPVARSHLLVVLLNGTAHVGSQAEYRCADAGAKLVGRSVVQCQASGVWETVDAVCETGFARIPVEVNSPLHLDDGMAVDADNASHVFPGDLAAVGVTPGADAKGIGASENAMAIGVGLGVALALLLLVAVLICCGLRYRRKSQSGASTPPSTKKRGSPYGTLRRLQASQISSPIAVLQSTNPTSCCSPSPKTSETYDTLTPQTSLSGGSAVSEAASSETTNRDSATYLKSTLGKASLKKLYTGTLRAFSLEEAPNRERPRVPKLVISSPIECRKTVVVDGGRTATEVIYAQPKKPGGAGVPENHYEYLETARVHGGYGNPLEAGLTGEYADTTLRGALKDYLPEELYDDVSAAIHK